MARSGPQQERLDGQIRERTTGQTAEVAVRSRAQVVAGPAAIRNLENETGLPQLFEDLLGEARARDAGTQTLEDLAEGRMGRPPDESVEHSLPLGTRGPVPVAESAVELARLLQSFRVRHHAVSIRPDGS